jgi:hypothetical protein
MSVYSGSSAADSTLGNKEDRVQCCFCEFDDCLFVSEEQCPLCGHYRCEDCVPYKRVVDWVMGLEEGEMEGGDEMEEGEGEADEDDEVEE